MLLFYLIAEPCVWLSPDQHALLHLLWHFKRAAAPLPRTASCSGCTTLHAAHVPAAAKLFCRNPCGPCCRRNLCFLRAWLANALLWVMSMVGLPLQGCPATRTPPRHVCDPLPGMSCTWHLHGQPRSVCLLLNLVRERSQTNSRQQLLRLCSLTLC